MKNHNRCSWLQLILAAVLTLSIATSVNAALVSRLNGQAVYDTDLNVTWLSNSLLAGSNTFGVAGAAVDLDWNTAQSWIGAMNAANYLGFSDWRLPKILGSVTTCGQYPWPPCTGNENEITHLFMMENADTSGLFTTSPNYYWLGDECGSNCAYAAIGGGGGAMTLYFTKDLSVPPASWTIAWAVRTGDVAAVPVPAAFWLLGSGLIGLSGFVRRREL